MSAAEAADVQKCMQDLRAGRRNFDTAAIDFKLSLEKGKTHPMVATGLTEKLEADMAAAIAIDDRLLNTEKGFRVNGAGSVDVIANKTMVADLATLLLQCKATNKKITNVME